MRSLILKPLAVSGTGGIAGGLGEAIDVGADEPLS